MNFDNYLLVSAKYLPLRAQIVLSKEEYWCYLAEDSLRKRIYRRNIAIIRLTKIVAIATPREI
ncbi:MAG: hypothetical protein H6Q13_3223 [Bacteroidetes bacterium]|nr:hypothetical protein [Bacteroidota bacterium]